MYIVVIVVAVAAAVVLYLFGCYLALVFVTTPLSLVAAALGVVGGAGILLYRGAVVLAGRDAGTSVRTPAEVVARPLSGRLRDRYVRRDFAWPQYFVVQNRLDLARIVAQPVRVCWELWRRTFQVVRRWDPKLLLGVWPLLIPVAVFLLGVSAGVLAAAVAVALVFAVVTVAAWALALPVLGLLRLTDLGWQRMFRAAASCPHCYAVTDLPAYRCPGPHPAEDRRSGRDLHRNLRPGRLGVFWRRCGCGTTLPTTVLRAAFRLTAVCPTCREPLQEGAAVHTDVRVPVFGSASAGKTHLIMAAIVTLRRSGADGGVSVSLPDDHAERTFRGYAEIVDRDGSAPKTDPSCQPVAMTLRIEDHRRGALVHVFDAAGEALADPEQNTQLAYLDAARTLVFVLDPFSVPRLRDRYLAGYPAVVAEANAATDAPEASYQATAQRLRDQGVDTRRKRLAFVVSKRDLLERLPLAKPPQSSAAVRAWLQDLGLGGLLTAAERDFGTVRYFLVSAKGAGRRGEAFTPFRWLLADEPVTLPDAGTGPPPPRRSGDGHAVAPPTGGTS